MRIADLSPVLVYNHENNVGAREWDGGMGGGQGGEGGGMGRVPVQVQVANSEIFSSSP